MPFDVSIVVQKQNYKIFNYSMVHVEVVEVYTSR